MGSKSASILVIESQPMMLAALSVALSSEGMTVLGEISDSSQAIQSVVKFSPSLVVFSVGGQNLPDLERISALRHELPNVLILALVSGDFRGQERMALDYGAHRVLTKAATRAELISALQELFLSAANTKKEANA